MNRNEIPPRLRVLADSMDYVASEMNQHRDLDTCYGHHGGQLRGAATVARSWADKIEQMELEKTADAIAEGRQS